MQKKLQKKWQKKYPKVQKIVKDNIILINPPTNYIWRVLVRRKQKRKSLLMQNGLKIPITLHYKWQASCMATCVIKQPTGRVDSLSLLWVWLPPVTFANTLLSQSHMAHTQTPWDNMAHAQTPWDNMSHTHILWDGITTSCAHLIYDCARSFFPFRLSGAVKAGEEEDYVVTNLMDNGGCRAAPAFAPVC